MNQNNNEFKPIAPKTVRMDIIQAEVSRISISALHLSVPIDNEPPIYQFWDDFFDLVHKYDFTLHELYVLPYKISSKSHLRIHACIGMLLYAQQIKYSTGFDCFTHLRLIAGISERLFKEVKSCISHLKSDPKREDKKSLLVVMNYMALLIARQNPVAATSPKYYAMVDHLKLYLGHWVTKLREKEPDTVVKSLQEYRRQLKGVIILTRMATVGEVEEFFLTEGRKQRWQELRSMREELDTIQKNNGIILAKVNELIPVIKTIIRGIHGKSTEINALIRLQKELSRIREEVMATNRALAEKFDSMDSETRRLPQLETDRNKRMLQEVNAPFAKHYEYLFESAFGVLWTGDQLPDT